MTSARPTRIVAMRGEHCLHEARRAAQAEAEIHRHEQDRQHGRPASARQRIEEQRKRPGGGDSAAGEDHPLGPEARGEPAGMIGGDGEEGDAAHLHDHEIGERAAKRRDDHDRRAEHEGEQAAEREGLAQSVAQEDGVAQQYAIAAGAGRAGRAREAVPHPRHDDGEQQGKDRDHVERAPPAPEVSSPRPATGASAGTIDSMLPSNPSARTACSGGKAGADDAGREDGGRRPGRALQEAQGDQRVERARLAGRGGEAAIGRERKNEETRLVVTRAEARRTGAGPPPRRRRRWRG